MRNEFERWTRFWQKINRFQGIRGNIRKHLNKTRTDTHMKFYKVVARPTLLYGSQIWVTTKRDMTRLEAAEMRFLRSVKGYTKLDKIRSEVIRKELEISGIQDVRSKHKTKLDQPSWKNGQYQTPETRPQLQTSRKKGSWTPQETMATRRCRNSSNDLIHGGR